MMTEDCKEQIVSLYNSGMSVRAVSDKLGISKSTIGDFVRFKGISRTDFKGVNNPFYGKKHSPEFIERDRQRMLGTTPANKGKSKYGSTKYFHGMFICYWQNGAKVRNIEYSITGSYLDQLWEQQQGKCALSGAQMSNDYHADKFSSVSLDRIDSNLGYTEGNVQLVLGIINIMKNVLTNDQFTTYCEKVVEHGKK
jgi:hypothetical protein